MHPRPLFAVLILGFAIGIACAETDDLAELDDMSAEELTRLLVEGLKAWTSKTNIESQELIKFILANSMPDLPELLTNIDLPIDHFLDLFLQNLLDFLKDKSPSEKAKIQKNMKMLLRKFMAKFQKGSE